MAQITFEFEDKKYKLDYTLDTAASANSDGFVLGEMADKPAEMIPKLVYWAFVHNHKGITRKKAMAVYEGITGKTEFITALTEMYVDACQALFDTDETEEGNANWTLA